MVLLVTGLILVGIGLTAYYGVRTVRSYRQLHHMPLRPGETDVTQIREWMTIPYIAHAYRVPESVLWTGLGIPEAGNRNKNLHTLERQMAGEQPASLLEKVRSLITRYQGQHPTPAPSSTPAISLQFPRYDLPG